MLRLWFDKGTILLKGEVGTPYGKWDSRVDCYRIKAYHYRDVLEYLAESKLQVEDDVPMMPPLEHLKSNVELRDYQNEALNNWCKAGNRGVLGIAYCGWKNFHRPKSNSTIESSNTDCCSHFGPD